MIIEISNFKEIREDAGRKIADDIMMKISNSIFGRRREQDIFCRFSSDEFLLLLPGTPEEGAKQVEERIVTAIKADDYTDQNLNMAVALNVAFDTARGDDLDADGMIDTVTKKVALHCIEHNQETKVA